MLHFTSMLRRILQYISYHRTQLAKYLLVGFGTFFFNFFIFHLFYSWLHLDYRIAISLSYVLSVIVHFSLHRMFTFGGAGAKMVQSAGKYALMLGFNYAITLTIAWLVVEVLRISPSLIVVLSTAVTASMSFFIMKYFVFGSREESL